MMSDLWWPKFIRRPRLRIRRPQFRDVQMPSKWIIFATALVIYYFIVSGGMFTLSYQPEPFFQTAEAPLLLYPSIHRQFLIEGIVGGSMYFIGFLGFYLMYQSTRNIYRNKLMLPYYLPFPSHTHFSLYDLGCTGSYMELYALIAWLVLESSGI